MSSLAVNSNIQSLSDTQLSRHVYRLRTVTQYKKYIFRSSGVERSHWTPSGGEGVGVGSGDCANQLMASRKRHNLTPTTVTPPAGKPRGFETFPTVWFSSLSILRPHCNFSAFADVGTATHRSPNYPNIVAHSCSPRLCQVGDVQPKAQPPANSPARICVIASCRGANRQPRCRSNEKREQHHSTVGERPHPPHQI